jgi:hypothetical protein
MMQCVQDKMKVLCGQDTDLAHIFDHFANFWGNAQTHSEESKQRASLFPSVGPQQVPLGPERTRATSRADGSTSEKVPPQPLS